VLWGPTNTGVLAPRGDLGPDLNPLPLSPPSAGLGRLPNSPPQQLRQLGDVGDDPPHLVVCLRVGYSIGAPSTLPVLGLTM